MTVKANTSLTQVRPVNPVEEAHNGPDDGKEPGLRERQTSDSMEEKTLRAVRLEFGASSKEYMTAIEQAQEVEQVLSENSFSASKGEEVDVSVITTVA